MIHPEFMWHLGRLYYFLCCFAEGAYYESLDGYFALTGSNGEVQVSEQKVDLQESIND